MMTGVVPAQTLAKASPLPDSCYKADILAIVAHPDDETPISAYLAKATLDDGKGVAVDFAGFIVRLPEREAFQNAQ